LWSERGALVIGYPLSVIRYWEKGGGRATIDCTEGADFLWGGERGDRMNRMNRIFWEGWVGGCGSSDIPVDGGESERDFGRGGRKVGFAWLVGLGLEGQRQEGRCSGR